MRRIAERWSEAVAAAAKRGMRPIGVGCHNWLFASADADAKTLARAQIIIKTAEMNGRNPKRHSRISPTASTITKATGSTNRCRETAAR